VATFLLDTSVIIDVLNGKRGRRGFLLGMAKQGSVFACCPINVTEVYAGLRPNEEAGTEQLLQTFEYYQLTWAVARKAGLLKRDLARKGITVGVADATIAAVAIVNSLTLVTDNVKDFPEKELSLLPLPSPQ
jgi:predicted nucleic acid-binding protein